MTSSGCSDEDDDGDDDVAFTGDDVMSSAGDGEVALAGCDAVPLPMIDPGALVVHIATPGCSASGDGVDVVW